MKRFGLNKSEARINVRVKMSAQRAAFAFNLRRFAKDLVGNMVMMKEISAV
jgi:hypothetical protein